MIKQFLVIVLVLVMIQVCPAQVPESFSQTPIDLDRQELEDKIIEFGQEFEKKMIETLKELLNKEIQRLERGKKKADEIVKKQLQDQKSAIRNNPEDAKAYFTLGEIYDSIGDGAKAILNTQMAEKLFIKQKNVEGVAKARRALRNYYQQYRFKPEDFKLPNKK